MSATTSDIGAFRTSRVVPSSVATGGNPDITARRVPLMAPCPEWVNLDRIGLFADWQPRLSRDLM